MERQRQKVISLAYTQRFFPCGQLFMVVAFQPVCKLNQRMTNYGKIFIQVGNLTRILVKL